MSRHISKLCWRMTGVGAPALALTMDKLSLHQIKAPFSTLIRVQLDLEAAEC